MFSVLCDKASGAKPAKRLTALAHELASDGILPGAGKKAHAAMHLVLDNFPDNVDTAKLKAGQKITDIKGKEWAVKNVDLESGKLDIITKVTEEIPGWKIIDKKNKIT